MKQAREPKVVAEAQAEIRKGYLWMLWPGIVIMLGWIPILAMAEYGGDVGVLVALALYMVGVLGGTAGIVWKAQQIKWATDLVESWQRTQAEVNLRDALREEGMAVPNDDVPSAVMMGRIREHLEMDARALKAAEEAHCRLTELRAEEAAAREAVATLPEGDGKERLAQATATLASEAREIEGSLAALYATLLTRDAQPTHSGLKDTMLELEAEAEVSKTSSDEQERLRLKALERAKTRK